MQHQEYSEKSTLTTEDQMLLYSEQVKQLYSNARVGLLATAINSLVLALIQRNVTSRTSLIAWLALLAGISLLRYNDIRTFHRRSPGVSEANRWARKFIVGLALSGMGWGSAAIFLFPAESLAHQTFLAFVIGGMVAGAAAAFSSVMEAFFAYSLPALTPIIVRFALIGDEFHVAMGGMTLLFGFMMVLIAKRINHVRIASLKLSFQNRDLVSYLTAAKQKSDELNKELLLEVAERERIEKELRNSEGHLRYLSAELLNAQEKERRLIVQEIHDSIGSSLAAVKFKTEAIFKQVGKGRPQTRAHLESIIPMIQGTIDEARRIQMALRPSILDDLGILATLSWFCREFETTYSAIRVNKEIGIQEVDIPDSLKTVIYRVSQEALNNIAKHSKASEVSLSLVRTGQAITLTIGDNGQGFDLSAALSHSGTGGGLGLNSMRERVELSGGAYSIECIEGAGTVVRASWPLPG